VSTAKLEEDAEVEEAVEDPVVDAPPAAPEAPDVEALEDAVLTAALDVPDPETTSPTSPESEAIVPSSGAVSFVWPTARSSLWTVNWSLRTVARAEARFASAVAALTVEVPLPPLVAPEPPPALGVLAAGAGAAVAGALFVAGAVLVAGAVFAAGVVFVDGLVVVGAGVEVVGCVIAAVVLTIALDDAAADPAEDPDPAELLDWPPDSSCWATVASADCSVARACWSVASAFCGSSVASS
jgi:hypothetical protein